MSIAISEEHRALAQTVADFLSDRQARAAARGLLEADADGLPAFWAELGALGLLGLHVPEGLGGSGFGLLETLVVAEEMGRHLAPGPFVPTVITSAVLAAAGPDDLCKRLMPALADGTLTGAAALGGDVTYANGAATGKAGIAISGHLAGVLLVPAGDDVLVIEKAAGGVQAEVPANLDPSRRAARVRLDEAPATVLPGAGRLLTDVARAVLAAEAAGIARHATEQAAEYAKVRQQFGRPIATFQAVKHHCANMLVAAELAAAAAWDAGRAGLGGGDQLSYAAAIAAVLAVPAAVGNASLNIQVHGGIGFTWEHDAHLYLRRAAAIAAVADTERAAIEVTDLVRRGVRRAAVIDLPAAAEPIRAAVRADVARLRELTGEARKQSLIDSGYAMPHWPKPWGRDAAAIEQLVIQQEFASAGIKRPSYGITSWIILTLIQHASPDQVARWVRPALDQDVIWCQLFSEPDAGSDAAGIRTRAARTESGWRVTGQKVWTSGAHLADFGLATVRTNPDAPKHEGITMMVIDMHAPGVTVRPLKMPTGNSDFNEVFLDDVFVPDTDVVGPVDGGWTVARATLGNESVSIGGDGGRVMPAEAFVVPLDAHPERLAGGAGRVGRHIARTHAIGVLNQRSAHRAVAGGGPGPEGNITKLLLSEIGHETAAIMAELAGPDAAFTEGDGAMPATLVLMHRAMSIAGGTSEIKRNQIAERILGLPRDPLIKLGAATMAAVPSAVAHAAAAFGLDVGSLRALGGNSGSAWSAGNRVLRVGRPATIDAELAASSAAAAVVPVPAVLDRTEAGDASAVLLEKLPGRPAAEFARSRPELARSAGLACGAVHALLAGVHPPAGLRPAPGPAPSGRARVVHLDLHPFNILTGADGEVTGVLDWANAAAGDPDLDRARTWTILTLDPAARARGAEPGWAQLRAGWTESGGLHDIPAAYRAWACAFMLSDLAGRYAPDDLRHIAKALDEANATARDDLAP